MEGNLKLITECGVESMSFPGWKEEPHSPASLTLKRPSAVGGDEHEDYRLLCRVVVAADGKNSGIRLKRGLITSSLGYGQRALVATLQTNSKVSSSLGCEYLPMFDLKGITILPPRMHPM